MQHKETPYGTFWVGYSWASPHTSLLIAISHVQQGIRSRIFLTLKVLKSQINESVPIIEMGFEHVAL